MAPYKLSYYYHFYLLLLYRLTNYYAGMHYTVRTINSLIYYCAQQFFKIILLGPATDLLT